MGWLRTKKLDQRSDEELAIAYKQSENQDLLGLLYGRYMELIYGLCLGYFKSAQRAEDATLDIYVELQDKLLKHEVLKFRPWLYQLARNHCLMILRRSASHLSKTSTSVSSDLKIDDEAVMHLADNPHLYLEAMEKERLHQALEWCTSALPKLQQACINRFYIQGESYLSIANEFEIKKSKVRSAIQNGRRNLKNCLAERMPNA